MLLIFKQLGGVWGLGWGGVGRNGGWGRSKIRLFRFDFV